MLNVLPAEYKTALHQSLLHHRVRRFSSFVIISMVLLGSIVLSAEWLLWRWQTDLPVNTTIAQITPEERDQLEHLVTALQQTSAAVQTTAHQFHNPLNDVLPIVKDTPTDIQLHTLSIDYSTAEMRLTGTADNRENLVAYQQALEQKPFLEKIIIPLSNLDIKEQIPFAVTARLHNDEPSK